LCRTYLHQTRITKLRPGDAAEDRWTQLAFKALPTKPGGRQPGEAGVFDRGRGASVATDGA